MTFRTDLEPIVDRIETEILRIAGQRVPGVKLQRIGPIEIGSRGPSWSCWLITATDAERDLLAKDAGLLTRIQEVSEEIGLAPDSITVQSQETVDRDFEGSWFYAMR
jgi:hypothetical protein